MKTSSKKAVHDFWNSASCGEELYLKETDRKGFQEQSASRYELEPYIFDFAEFHKWGKKKVLEIGVGLGAEHQKFAEANAFLEGIDLTERAVSYTTKRLELFGLKSKIRIADAENLPYKSGSFDLVYSWGVLHHSPNTSKAIEEVRRVLKPGGEARIMIYHKHSLVGYMLWIRYALFAGNPFRSLHEVYANHLESPGTKAYSLDETRGMFRNFTQSHLDTILTHSDLLMHGSGQRHRGVLLTVMNKIYPRFVIRTLFQKSGLYLLIRAIK